MQIHLGSASQEFIPSINSAFGSAAVVQSQQTAMARMKFGRRMKDQTLAVTNLRM